MKLSVFLGAIGTMLAQTVAAIPLEATESSSFSPSANPAVAADDAPALQGVALIVVGSLVGLGAACLALGSRLDYSRSAPAGGDGEACWGNLIVRDAQEKSAPLAACFGYKLKTARDGSHAFERQNQKEMLVQGPR